MAKFSTCNICGKLVDIDQESHTLFHCRNFLLRSFYGEKNEHRRARLQERIDALNIRMRTKGNNLLDT